MKLKFIKPVLRNPGDRQPIEEEKNLDKCDFRVFKFSEREPSDKTIIFCSFSEFGCESINISYVIPDILRSIPEDCYRIGVGWYGREYLYRHLVDEFWELKQDYQWLREYARASHHKSKNLARLEKSLESRGTVITSLELGDRSVSARCKDCGFIWHTLSNDKCKKCLSSNVVPSFFGNVPYWKQYATRIPMPSTEKIGAISKYVTDKSVGVFARGRKCYGRNLQPEFYIKLIELLESMGYEPIWLGEKESTQPCPVGRILDFSRLPESRDLETTLAIISKLKFTLQFWTASTRLSSIVNTPYILFESPDQIWGNGQEGFRRNLFDFRENKLIAAHFLDILNNNDEGIYLASKAIEDVENGDFSDILSPTVIQMKKDNHLRIGGTC